ncbi:helix-turn-helix transcriptional regulator [Rhodoferax aquaticus]|uniref:LuxR family transcriptional regulator n=1 Tax=Rhodoferax aquaticus TaxID=2527691 RepID=A0A515ESX6_9BURK|nr:LuxR family transcriptional regulator [Rhodoferax aquaticus]QDL55776.1 LuxR family transcriptional regulator [Rhodoferax aquaticus]
MIADVMGSQDQQELLGRIKTIVQKVGFDTFMVGLERRAEDGRIAHYVMSDYPQRWQQLYDQQGYAALDPTVAYCQKSRAPLVWSAEFFQKSKAGFMLEEARSYGLHHGVSLSVHDRFATKSMMSLVRDQDLTKSATESAYLLNCAQVISACVHQVAHQLLETNQKKQQSTLTARESECLQWIAVGKSTPEISDILNVSEPTVAFHVKNLMRKLDVHTRPQALAKAMRMGLIG